MLLKKGQSLVKRSVFSR